MKKMVYQLLFFVCLKLFAEKNPLQYDAFHSRSVYTITNNTQYPLDLTWQSGGGSSFDELNGKEGSLHLTSNTAPFNTGKIIVSDGCLDWINVVKSGSTANSMRLKDVCSDVSIEYENGDITREKLIFTTS